MEVVRGRTIKQDKMLHDAYPVVDLLSQISGSNAGSNSLVEILGRICRSNCQSKSWIKFLDQIPGSNLLVKSAGQMQPILGPPLASLGECMGAPADRPKTA